MPASNDLDVMLSSYHKGRQDDYLLLTNMNRNEKESDRKKIANLLHPFFNTIWSMVTKIIGGECLVRKAKKKRLQTGGECKRMFP